MIVLIDNYDSFSYNLYQLIGAIEPEIKVIRNDEMTLEQLKQMEISYIILSPGPGHPKDAGICMEVVKHFAGKIPILGVCLGHQVICEAYGAEVTYAKELMHGKQSEIIVDTKCRLFKVYLRASRRRDITHWRQKKKQCRRNCWSRRKQKMER